MTAITRAMFIRDGPYRPEFGAQRGSVMDMPVHAGDPLTPGLGQRSRRQENRIEDSQDDPEDSGAADFLRRCAPILRQLKGKVVPNEWKGALPFTYHVGPGPAQVHMNLRFEWKNRPLYNVVARIPARRGRTNGSSSATTTTRG